MSVLAVIGFTRDGSGGNGGKPEAVEEVSEPEVADVAEEPPVEEKA